MTMLPDAESDRERCASPRTTSALDYHNDGHSHIDALCHVAFDGALYTAPATLGHRRRREGGAIEALKDGLVGRGVLLDVPRLRGVRGWSPGEHVVPRGPRGGGARPGRSRRRGRHPARPHRPRAPPGRAGPWDTDKAKAGLHPTAAPFLAERRVAALGSDGNSDTAPSTTEGVAFPIHVLAINAMGVHLLDYLQFEDLAVACERGGRWEFLFVVAPLRIGGGTGSPVNPIAVF